MSTTLEAFTDCPSCHHIGVHYLRCPRVCLTHPHRGATTTDIRAYGMSKVLRSIQHPPPGYHDETPFDCIRTCRACGHQWGQRLTPIPQLPA